MMHIDVEEIAERGLAFANRGDRQSAIECFQEAIRGRPDFAQAHHNLGVALADSGRFEEGIASLREAIRYEPSYAEAHYNLGAIWNQIGKPDEAFDAFKESHRLRPNHPETLNNLGLGLIHRKNADEAIILLRHALRLRPDFPAAYNNLGLAYADVGEYVRAEESYEHALRGNPCAVDTLNNLASLYRDWGNLRRSLATYDLAMAIDPEHISTRWNRSLCLLQMEDYGRGWAEYECRRNKPGHVILSFPQPYWDGSSLSGRTLLLHAEQGRGDAIQFIRYAPLIPRSGTVAFLCPRDLADLLRTAQGIDRFIVDGERLPSFDTHASLMSLPALLGQSAIPRDVPYLFPDASRRTEWKSRLDAIPGIKVGIAWQGNPQHANDHHRSLSLKAFEALAKAPGVSLVSLQRGHGTDQIDAFAKRAPLAVFPQDSDDTRAFIELAALIAELDAVVSVDTAVAHLAGALGVETYVLVSTHTDWRWHLRRSDSDWYPSATILRQNQLDDWEPVIAEAAKRVSSRAGRPMV